MGDVYVCLHNSVSKVLASANLGASEIRVVNFLAHPVAFDTERCRQLVEAALTKAIEGFDRSTIE